MFKIIMLFFQLFFIPLVYLIISILLTIKKRGLITGKAAGISLICYFISLVLGTLNILSSRGSTAAVGFIFLLNYSLISAAFGFIYVIVKKKWAKTTVLIFLAYFYGFIIHSTYKEMAKNAERDKVSRDRSSQTQNNREWLNDLALRNPKEAKRWMEEQVRKSTDDTWLIAIADSELATTELLIELSRKPNAPLLSIIRNPNVPVSILEYAYRKTNYPDYYFADLAGNSNTPQEILLELYNLHRHKNTGIEMNLAGNRKVPSQLIEKLISSNDPLVLGKLVQNPSIDCLDVLKGHKKLMELDPKIKFYSTGVGWAEVGYQRCTHTQ